MRRVVTLRLRPLRAILLAACVGACLAPTLPIPPPSTPELTAIDGKVEVVGEKGSVQSSAQVSVINTTLEQFCVPAGCSQVYSRIVPAAPDGSYATEVDGKSGDTISVTQQVGDSISGAVQSQVP